MTRKLRPWLVAALAALAAVPAWALSDDGGGRHNYVKVVNHSDGKERERSRVVVSRNSSNTVDNENVAYAESSCSDCRTVAAAMQAVLITSSANDIQPKNVAVAVNYECTSCRTFAAAYQYVVTTDGPARFDEEGRERIESIEDRVEEATEESNLPFNELQARLDALYQELKTVVQEELEEEKAEFEAKSRRRTDRDD
jgi:hypothetical protein